MCGIFGAIGKYNKATVRFLAYLNESRGSHAFGFMTDSCIVKDGISIKDYLKKDSGIFKIVDDAPFLVGHTRHATCGDKDNAEHAHPFNKGHVTGVHNGCISNTTELSKTLGVNYVVDSEYIFESLNQETDINEALKKCCGSWCLFWSDDRTPDYVYLAKHTGVLHFCKTSTCIYFSSDDDHLKIALSPNHKIEAVPYDEGFKINVNTLEMESFKIKNVQQCSYTSTNNRGTYYHDFDVCGNRVTREPRLDTDDIPAPTTQEQEEVNRSMNEHRQPTAQEINDAGGTTVATADPTVTELFTDPNRATERHNRSSKGKYFTCSYCSQLCAPEKKFGGIIYGESEICDKCAAFFLKDEIAKY